jgi:hypothetical protein
MKHVRASIEHGSMGTRDVVTATMPIEASLEHVGTSTKHVRTSPEHIEAAPKPALLALKLSCWQTVKQTGGSFVASLVSLHRFASSICIAPEMAKFYDSIIFR